MKVVGGSKPAMFGSASKAPSGGGAGLFKKPGMMGIGKKKFQLDVAAPSENDLKQIQKVENKLFAPKINLKKPAEGGQSNFLGLPKKDGPGMLSKASLNQMSGASIGEKKVADSFARPMALQEKTKQVLA